MSKLACLCGAVISDNTTFLPYKAFFLPDEDSETALEVVTEQIAEFIEARERGDQELFLKQRAMFLRDTSLRSVLFNLFCHPTFEFGRTMYECNTCGRIWMQAVPDENYGVYFQPESDRRGILRHQ